MTTASATPTAMRDRECHRLLLMTEASEHVLSISLKPRFECLRDFYCMMKELWTYNGEVHQACAQTRWGALPCIFRETVYIYCRH